MRMRSRITPDRRWHRRFATRRLAVLSAAVALVLGMAAPWSPAVRGAEPTSDIPGVPLPGSVVSSLLGGPIYDVVYSIDVAAGEVVVIGLTGSTGTDFDLYLFDSSATTVVNDVGVVASSRGPTSAEHLSYPVRVGGRFYIDLNGATDVEGTFILTVQVVPDPTPPTASVSLAGGRAAVGNPTVTVDVTAYDDLSGVSDMAFSEDGTTWTDWRPLAAPTSWTFPGGDGPKTLWAKVRNGVGLESTPASAVVQLDTVPPSISRVTPLPGSRVSGLRPVFGVDFNEEVDPASWGQLGLIIQSANGGLVAGAYQMDEAHRTGTFTPAEDLVAGQSYVVTVGRVTDVAGNAIVPVASWVVTPVLPSGVSLRVTPAVVVFGASSVISGAFEGSDPSPVLSLLHRPAGATTFTLLAQSWPGADAVARFTVQPAMNTWYRLSYAGSATTADASTETRILVRRGVRLTVTGVSSGSSRVGRRVTLTATIDPPAAGVSVSFRLYRYDAARRTFRYAGSWGRLTSQAGQVTYAWTPTTPGVYRWRVAVLPTPDFANNTSPVYGWTVRS